jgi:hypothetical protein
MRLHIYECVQVMYKLKYYGNYPLPPKVISNPEGPCQVSTKHIPGWVGYLAGSWSKLELASRLLITYP